MAEDVIHEGYYMHHVHFLLLENGQTSIGLSSYYPFHIIFCTVGLY